MIFTEEQVVDRQYEQALMEISALPTRILTDEDISSMDVPEAQSGRHHIVVKMEQEGEIFARSTIINNSLKPLTVDRACAHVLAKDVLAKPEIKEKLEAMGMEVLIPAPLRILKASDGTTVGFDYEWQDLPPPTNLEAYMIPSDMRMYSRIIKMMEDLKPQLLQTDASSCLRLLEDINVPTENTSDEGEQVFKSIVLPKIISAAKADSLNSHHLALAKFEEIWNSRELTLYRDSLNVFEIIKILEDAGINVDTFGNNVYLERVDDKVSLTLIDLSTKYNQD